MTQSGRSIQPLAGELIIKIFDHLRPSDDLDSEHRSKTVFFQLSLTSRSLRVHSLPFLFEALTFEKQGDENWNSRQLTSFCQSIVDGNERALELAQYVRRCVFIDDSSTYIPFIPFKDIYTRAVQYMKNVISLTFKYTLLDDEICEMIVQLPRLETLSIVGGVRTSSNLTAPKDWAAMVASVRTIRNLHYGKVVFASKESKDILTEHMLSLDLRQLLIVDRRLSSSFLNSARIWNLQDLNLQQVTELELFTHLLNSTPTLRAVRVGWVGLECSALRAPALSLEPSSIPLLEIFHGPGGWIRDIVPGRPVKDVDISGKLFDFQVRGPATIAISGMDSDPDSLVFLQGSTKKIQCLRLGPEDYYTYILKRDLPIQFSISELILDGFLTFAGRLRGQTRFESKFTRTLDDALVTFQTLAGAISSTVQRLELTSNFFNEWWDLQFQHEVIMTYAAPAFPNASRIQICEWVEWRRQESNGATILEWLPSLHLSVDGRKTTNTFTKFRRMIKSDEFKSRLKDYAEFFKGYSTQQ